MLDRLLRVLAAALRLARRETGTVMAGFTHLQPAQPASLGHYLAGIATALLRPGEALEAALERIDVSPLGAAAGYGTAFPIDPSRVAELLGFAATCDNSLDAVASRDEAMETLAAAARLGTVLSRWGHDFQHWSSRPYGFLRWPDGLVSTSSIMPQKRNAYVWGERPVPSPWLRWVA